MRMRRKKNRDTRFENCIELAVLEPQNHKGNWNKLFGNQNPVHVEIGCGKGGFILELARRNPDVNFVAIEKCLDVLILAMEKIKNEQIKNVRFLFGDANVLTDIFDCGEVERIYLNFSDPWKKSRQAKRRLTYVTFLEKYKYVLSEDGEVYFKTDNRPLFDFSLEQFELFGAKISELTFDLHNSEYNYNNIMTEYEKNFSEKGFPINRCVVTF
ncbi:MAG: tRNA (guanosine(46)-N7)-methyltransferase TrmB [Clostridia bacterium]|nr:tRNA (guanosine(46)-N7)-methyltransferase TrmB [Clostridia bacterium]